MNIGWKWLPEIEAVSLVNKRIMSHWLSNIHTLSYLCSVEMPSLRSQPMTGMYPSLISCKNTHTHRPKTCHRPSETDPCLTANLRKLSPFGDDLAVVYNPGGFSFTMGRRADRSYIEPSLALKKPWEIYSSYTCKYFLRMTWPEGPDTLTQDTHLLLQRVTYT